MNRSARVAASFVIATATFAAGAGTAHAATTMKSLKDKGYTCEHAATNMTVCSKSGEKDQTCSESEDSCVVLRKSAGTKIDRVVAPPRASQAR